MGPGNHGCQAVVSSLARVCGHARSANSAISKRQTAKIVACGRSVGHRCLIAKTLGENFAIGGHRFDPSHVHQPSARNFNHLLIQPLFDFTRFVNVWEN